MSNFKQHVNYVDLGRRFCAVEEIRNSLSNQLSLKEDNKALDYVVGSGYVPPKLSKFRMFINFCIRNYRCLRYVLNEEWIIIRKSDIEYRE